MLDKRTNLYKDESVVRQYPLARFEIKSKKCFMEKTNVESTKLTMVLQTFEDVEGRQ